MNTKALTDVDQANQALRKEAKSREANQELARSQLRDFAVQLREPGQPYARAPASTKQPSFLVGPTPNFNYPVQSGRPVDLSRGQLSSEAHTEFMSLLKTAMSTPQITTRDNATQQAANTVAKDYGQAKGVKHGVSPGLLHELRAQVGFHAQALGESLGLSSASSSALAHSLERALEREGFKVLVNHTMDKGAALGGYLKDALDPSAASARTTNGSDQTLDKKSNVGPANETDSPKSQKAAANPDMPGSQASVERANNALERSNSSVDDYRPSTASTASATGVRHQMERGFNNSMQWLADHGVSKDAIKGALNRHAGKILVVAELSQNPEVIQRASQVIAGSDNALDMVVKASKDDELKKAVGTLAIATGETATAIPGGRGVGSVAIVAGAALRGDSMEDIGRHAFRAAMAVAGGAVGGMAGMAGGPLALGTAVVGSELGSRLADVILDKYDSWFGNGKTNDIEKTNLVDAQQVKASSELIAQRSTELAKSEGSALSGRGASLVNDRLEQEREMQLAKK